MEEKKLVYVMLPATRRTYDFMLPTGLSVRDACALIARILESREPARFAATGENALMHGDTGDLLDPNRTIGQAGLYNGSRLVLV